MCQPADFYEDNDGRRDEEDDVVKPPPVTSPSSPSSSSSTGSSSSSSSSSSPSDSNVNDNNNANHHDKQQPLNPYWTYLTEGLLHKYTKKFVVTLATHAARYPMTYIGSITFLSLALIAIGFFTNLTVVYSHEEIFTPFGSLPERHHYWVKEESGFAATRPFMVVLHRNGNSVLQAETVRYLFEALDAIQETPGYREACRLSAHIDRTTDRPACRLSSATQFWNHSLAAFQHELNRYANNTEEQDEYVVEILSGPTFPDGTPVFHEAILGNHQRRNNTIPSTTTMATTPTMMNDVASAVATTTSETAETTSANTLTTSQSMILTIEIPDLDKKSDELEKRILDRMEDLRQQWAKAADNNSNNANAVVLEYFTMYAYLLEFERAVYSDIVLVVVMMTIMVAFCCGVFHDRRDRIRSRSLVGLFSIATIGMSLMTGYGIVWIVGVPFTNIAMMVPFIVVGVGLDDTFIITGSYFRKSASSSQQQQETAATSSPKTPTSTKTNNQEEEEEEEEAQPQQEWWEKHDEAIIKRVEETMEEVGLSISLTTATTCFAFGLGIVSSIPAIRWLCIYGLVCIGVDFVYQCSYFVAWMVLDEKRVQANRKDCCFWISLESEQEAAEQEEEEDYKEIDLDDFAAAAEPPAAAAAPSTTTGTTKNFSERFMGWYADKLLHPVTKICVLVFFALYLGGCVYSTTLLTQEFKVENYVPKDSHVKTFFVNFEAYSSLFRAIGVYFRDVDQSDPMVQQQMMTYVDELSRMDQIGEPAQFFWLRDFASMAQQPEFAQQAETLGLTSNATFEERVDSALQIPEVRDVYAKDIVRDPNTGEILASRCYLYLRKLDMASIPDQIAVLMDQREITQAQPINQHQEGDEEGNKDFSFFTFDDLYFFFELYSVSVDELIFTTISGVAAVSLVAFVLIPHWSSVLFVMPLIIALYFMLLGTMQYSGIHINAVTYVIIVMAIGLLVDFLMHMLLRYYETTGTTRHQKVKETLETMGASILLGGMTTFLGVMPLAFSTTTIFMVVFKSFLAMVCLGCGVGLILLPVLLSLFAPVVSSAEKTTTADRTPAREHGESGNTTTLTFANGGGSSKESLQSTDLEETKETDSSVDGKESSDLPTNEEHLLHLVQSTSQEKGWEIEV